LRRFERPSGGLQVERRTMRAPLRAAELRQSDACGPWRGGEREPGARRAWPCVHESRECVDDGSCSVDKYASCGLSPESCAKTSTWWVEKKGGKGT
jgi:hypothetical protein